MKTDSPFTVQPLQEPRFFQRLFKRVPKENAITELNNLLAQAPTVRDVTTSNFQRVAEKYNVDPARHFGAILKDMYRRYLRHCLADRELSDKEIEDLTHLKHLLALNDATVTQIHQELASSIYHESVEEAIADGKLDPQERDFLQKLQANLRLPDTIARRIYAERAQHSLQSRLHTAVQDQRLSPSEEEELHAIARNLDVQLEFDAKTRAALERYRTYWLLENGDIPEVAVGINLQRSEKCYAVRSVEWYEMRTVTKRIRYSGPTARIKIVKGLYWRIGEVAVQRVTEDIMKLIDVGQVVLTNKRLIFMGKQKNVNIQLKKVLDFSPYRNGIEIQKDTGKSPFLAFEQDLDIFALTLDRVIRDLNT